MNDNYDNFDVSLSLMDLKIIIDSLNKFKESITPTHPNAIEYVGNLVTYLHDKHDSCAAYASLSGEEDENV